MPRTKPAPVSELEKSHRPFPVHTLEKALVIISAIVDKGGSKQMDRLLVADAIGRTPSSSEFKRLLSSSKSYGLTAGTEKADYISPTTLGLKILKPTKIEESIQGKVQACLSVGLISAIFQQFNKQKLPDERFLKNLLERNHGLSTRHAEEFANLLVENAKFCGVLQDISGSRYIRLDDPSVLTSAPSGPESFEHTSTNSLVQTTEEPTPANVEIPLVLEKKPKLFLAHGKSRKPLDDLKNILSGFGINFSVAVDEPHAGRPISSKVAQLMNECTAGIFIFTKDELFFKRDDDGKIQETWRPSENVVYELGAAGILWDKKIIILREDGVNFPSDFSDLGYITFDSDGIGSKAMDIMKELIAFKLLRLQAA